MSTKAETKITVRVVETTIEAENPMQERHMGKVSEAGDVTAEAVLKARRLECREHAGSMFVP